MQKEVMDSCFSRELLLNVAKKVFEEDRHLPRKQLIRQIWLPSEWLWCGNETSTTDAAPASATPSSVEVEACPSAPMTPAKKVNDVVVAASPTPTTPGSDSEKYPGSNSSSTEVNDSSSLKTSSSCSSGSSDDSPTYNHSTWKKDGRSAKPRRRVEEETPEKHQVTAEEAATAAISAMLGLKACGPAQPPAIPAKLPPLPGAPGVEYEQLIACLRRTPHQTLTLAELREQAPNPLRRVMLKDACAVHAWLQHCSCPILLSGPPGAEIVSMPAEVRGLDPRAAEFVSMYGASEHHRLNPNAAEFLPPLLSTRAVPMQLAQAIGAAPAQMPAHVLHEHPPAYPPVLPHAYHQHEHPAYPGLLPHVHYPPPHVLHEIPAYQPPLPHYPSLQQLPPQAPPSYGPQLHQLLPPPAHSASALQHLAPTKPATMPPSPASQQPSYRMDDFDADFSSEEKNLLGSLLCDEICGR